MKSYVRLIVCGMLAAAASFPAFASTAPAAEKQVLLGGGQKLECRVLQKEDKLFLLTSGNIEAFELTTASKKEGAIGLLDLSSPSVRVFKNGEKVFVLAAGRVLQFEKVKPLTSKTENPLGRVEKSSVNRTDH